MSLAVPSDLHVHEYSIGSEHVFMSSLQSSRIGLIEYFLWFVSVYGIYHTSVLMLIIFYP